MDPGTAISVIPIFIPAAEFITTLIAAITAVLIMATRTTIPNPMPGTRVAEMAAAAAAAVEAMAVSVAVAEGTDIG